MYFMQIFSKYGLISFNNLLFHEEHFFTGISLLIALYKSTVDQHFIVCFTKNTFKNTDQAMLLQVISKQECIVLPTVFLLLYYKTHGLV